TVPKGLVNDRWFIDIPDSNTSSDQSTAPLPRTRDSTTIRAYRGDFKTPEYRSYPDIPARKWETCRGVGFSFGYNRAEDGDIDGSKGIVSTTPQLVTELVDVVAKGGNLLLGVGPKADGTIPDVQMLRLKGLHRWLTINAPGVYGTRPYRPSPEARTGAQAGGDRTVRVVQKSTGDKRWLFVTIMEEPGTAELTVHGVVWPLPARESHSMGTISAEILLRPDDVPANDSADSNAAYTPGTSVRYASISHSFEKAPTGGGFALTLRLTEEQVDGVKFGIPEEEAVGKMEQKAIAWTIRVGPFEVADDVGNRVMVQGSRI
ncbi:hypothetical protein HDU93_001489, partial [Gonapodya sp. JEL0774]